VQSAFIEATLAPKGVFKDSAKATVAVSAKLAVLDGVGKATEKQFQTVGIKTLQQLVEITPKQRELIANLPAPAMSSTLLEQLLARAKQGVDCILELSGVNAQVAEEAEQALQKAKAKKAAAGSEFVGPRLVPAFIRTALQTISHVADTQGVGIHCAPELCDMLSRLAQCCPGMLRVLVEEGGIETCIKLIVAPITFVEEVRARKKAQRQAEGHVEPDKDKKKPDAAATQAKAEVKAEPALKPDSKKDAGKTAAERREEEDMLAAIAAVEAAEAAEAKAAAEKIESSIGAGAGKGKRKKKGKAPAASAAAAATVASAAATPADTHPAPESKEPESKAAAASDSDDDTAGDDDDDDELTDLTDLQVVEVVSLLTVMVKGTTTRSGQPDQAVEPLPAVEGGVTISPQAWVDLRQPPFLTRLVLQISSAKPDSPCVLAAHLAWESVDTTDRLLDAIFVSIREHDFFDFYAGVKILQHLLMTLHDSVAPYRVELSMPRLLLAASEQRQYYKAAELLIKAIMHLMQHVPSVGSWAKLPAHMEEMKWMDAWLGRNKKMPEKRKPGEPRPPKDGITATKAVKFGKVSERKEQRSG